MHRVPPLAADLGLDGWTAGLHKVSGMTLEAVVGELLLNLSDEIIAPHGLLVGAGPGADPLTDG
jgi:hypothetical protein